VQVNDRYFEIFRGLRFLNTPYSFAQIDSGVFGWLSVKICLFPYTFKVVLNALIHNLTLGHVNRRPTSQTYRDVMADVFLPILHK